MANYPEKKTLQVHVHLLHQAAPVCYENVRNCYQKGSLYCVALEDGEVHKFPIEHLFRVKELYA